MNRRHFLSLASLAVAGLTLDPERLLWVPGQKAIFDLGPSPVHVMYGDWYQDESRLLYQRFVFTRVGGEIFGGTIVATPAQRRDLSWSQVDDVLTRRAIRDLDAAARHARATRVR